MVQPRALLRTDEPLPSSGKRLETVPRSGRRFGLGGRGARASRYIARARVTTGEAGENRPGRVPGGRGFGRRGQNAPAGGRTFRPGAEPGDGSTFRQVSGGGHSRREKTGRSILDESQTYWAVDQRD